MSDIKEIPLAAFVAATFLEMAAARLREGQLVEAVAHFEDAKEWFEAAVKDFSDD